MWPDVVEYGKETIYRCNYCNKKLNKVKTPINLKFLSIAILLPIVDRSLSHHAPILLRLIMLIAISALALYFYLSKPTRHINRWALDQSECS